MPNLVHFERNLDFAKEDDQDETGVFKADDSFCCIRGGELLRGRVDKMMVGSSSNSLLHHVVFYKGGQVAVQFLTMAQRLADAFLQHHGFSIGLSDMMVSESTHKEADQVLDAAKRIAVFWTLQNKPERMVAHCLNQARSVASSRTVAALKRNNSFSIMTNSGAKGTSVNLYQVATCVGQQDFANGRVENKFRDRTLPHFEPHDRSPMAAGFCENSYIAGLNPIEFFFHMMAGRIGLISTAVSTKDVGYMNHRLVKLFDEIKVASDGSVRDSRNRLYCLHFF